MKIVFETSGGFVFIAALDRPVTIDTAQMDPQTAHELTALIQSARFFDRPAELAPPAGAADYRTYTITVDDGRRVHTVRFTDPISDEALGQLVSRLRKLAHPPRP
jgi:hypothetical protein